MSSKQDRQGARTAADIERRYNFGKTFAEVYNLVADAQSGTEAAVKALDEKLDPEEIFNRLTDYGKVQGIYRGDDGDIYVNATYIKSGKLSAEYIDADNLKVNVANITGELVAASLKGVDINITDASGVAFGFMKKVANSIAFVGAENVNLLALNGWAKITASTGAEIQIGGTYENPMVSIVGALYAENYEARLSALETAVTALTGSAG